MAMLKTVKDFDFGVGSNLRLTNRVSESPQDVSKIEVDLIVWLMLEQEFRKAKRRHEIAKQKRKISAISSRTQYDGLAENDKDGDETDRPTIFDSILNENIRNAKLHAENALKDMGIDILWPDLEDSIRENIVLQLCRQSELLQDSILTVTEIFSKLRSYKFHSQFSIETRVGKGAYGEVFLATKRNDDKTYAVKRVVPAQSQLDDIKSAVNESRILKKLKGHKNIVEIYDYWLEIEPNDGNNLRNSNIDDEDDEEGPLKFYIQLEYCSPSLDAWKQTYIDRGAKPEKTQILNMALQIFEGLAHIHRHGILHLDINPKNILWKDHSYTQLKIVDFGLAVVALSHSPKIGTPGYIDPVHGSTLTPKSDVYSAAVTIIEVAKTIYTKSELAETIQHKDADLGIHGLDEFLTLALNEDPSKRPNAADIVSSLTVSQ